MRQMAQKIIVAMDDSENALRAVEYVAKSFTPDNEITLFSVILNTAMLCDMNSPELTPYFVAQQGTFCSLEDKKKELLNNALQKAKDFLLEAGFDENKIVIKVEGQKKGVARDIVDMAHSGYDLLVLGRRGLSGIKEFFLGSISQKVFQAVKDVSILIVN
jgi:nucleotide-binding universal stress UspA family protein